MNIYFGVLTAILIGLAVAGSAYEGHKIGVNSQKVEDQAQFDKINADITKQKTEAAAILAKVNAENTATILQRDKLKTDLGKAHAAAQIATDSLRTQLAGTSLRFAAQSSGCGASSGGAANSGPRSPGNDGAAVCQLSEPTSTAIKAIVLDADRLKDDYTTLYEWAHKVR